MFSGPSNLLSETKFTFEVHINYTLNFMFGVVNIVSFDLIYSNVLCNIVYMPVGLKEGEKYNSNG